MMDTTMTVNERMRAMRALQLKKQVEAKIVHLSQDDANRAPTVARKRVFDVSMDDTYWVELASKHNLLLPTHNRSCTTKGMEEWLRKLNLSIQWFYDWTGMTKLSEWPKSNPKKGLRTFAGLLLEELK